MVKQERRMGSGEGRNRRGASLQVEALESRVLLDGATPVIQDMVDSATIEDYTAYLTDIASFPDRNSYTDNIGDAADHIVAELEGMGLEVELQSFDLPTLGDGTPGGIGDSVTVSNIIATIPGKVTPEQEYVFSAHYDSVAVRPEDYSDPLEMVIDLLSPSSPAPGADDNGSGVAALLQTAGILSHYPFESTVKFVFFAAEEQGLVGSDYYAQYAYYEDPTVENPVPAPDDIRGAINYDMISYWDGQPDTGEDLDLFGFSGPTYGIGSYPNLEDILVEMNPDLTPEQVQYVMASLEAAIPPPPADSVDTSLLGQTFLDAVDTYGTDLEVNYVEGSTGDEWWLTGATSDHFNLWWYGWPALLCIEDMVYGIDPDTLFPYSTVTNPNYHTVEDNVDNANAKPFATSVTQTGLATIAELAGLRLGVVGGDFESTDPLALFDTSGDVEVVETEPGDHGAELRESSPASFTQHLVVPTDAGNLQYRARFVNPGDGDYLTVEFNGQEVDRVEAADLAGGGWGSFSADLSAYLSLPGELTFRLNDTGGVNARFQVDDIMFAGVSPTVGGLVASPDPVRVPEPLTLEAQNVQDADSAVSLVEFYRDDGNDTFEADQDTLLGTDDVAGDGWSWTGSTAGWTSGAYTYFARARDDTGLWSDAVATTGQVENFEVIATFTYPDGPTVSFYDTDPGNGLLDLEIARDPSEFTRTTDVLVYPGSPADGVVNSVLLRGGPADTSELGIVVEDAARLGSVRDVRRTPGGLGFLACDGDVGVVNLRGGMAGANLSGFIAEAGWSLPTDLDDDGSTDDPTGLYSTGRVGTFLARNTVQGDLAADEFGRVLVVMRPQAGTVGLGGDVDAVGSIVMARVVHGDLAGDVRAGGDVRIVQAVGGDVSGRVDVGGDLVLLRSVHGSIGGDVWVGGDARIIQAVHGDVAGDVWTGGSLRFVKAVGGDIAGSIDVAGDLGVAAAVRAGNTGGAIADRINVDGSARSIRAVRGDVAGPVQVGGALNSLVVNGGSLSGDVTVGLLAPEGDLGRLVVVGGDVGEPGGLVRVNGGLRQLLAVWRGGEGGSVNAAVDITGRAGVIKAVGGNIENSITVDGDLAALWAAPRGGAGGHVHGPVTVGGGLNALVAGEDLTGDVRVGGRLARVTVGQNAGPDTAGSELQISAQTLLWLRVRGDLEHARVEVDNLLHGTVVRGDMFNTTIEAGRLSRIWVGGTISEDGSDGDEDYLKAASGMFFARDSDEWAWVDDGTHYGDHWFDGVRAYVGTP